MEEWQLKTPGNRPTGSADARFVTSAAVAATAVGCGFDVAYDAEKALAYENDAANYKVTTTTCPYCSASCGQRVVTALTCADAGKVVDIYGDFESPMNSGGLCAKGAGSLQLVNNSRRIGAWTATHPVNPVFAADATRPERCGLQADRQRPLGRDGSARPRMGEIATGMVTARGARHRRRRLQQQGRRVPRLLAHEQRAELPVPQDDRELRYEQHRASGSYMTLVHGGRSGRRIRTRCNDEPLGRHGELDERRRHGCATRSRTTRRRSRTSTALALVASAIRRRT